MMLDPRFGSSESCSGWLPKNQRLEPPPTLFCRAAKVATPPDYVQSGVRERKAEASKLYADFFEGVSQTRLIEVRQFGDGLQVIEKMERETGIEPATSSLGIQYSFVNKGKRRSWRSTQCIEIYRVSSGLVEPGLTH